MRFSAASGWGRTPPRKPSRWRLPRSKDPLPRRRLAACAWHRTQRRVRREGLEAHGGGPPPWLPCLSPCYSTPVMWAYATTTTCSTRNAGSPSAKYHLLVLCRKNCFRSQGFTPCLLQPVLLEVLRPSEKPVVGSAVLMRGVLYRGKLDGTQVIGDLL